MTNERRACHQCGGRSIKTLGTSDYCSPHLSALYAKFDPAVFQHHGIGLQDGKLRPDWGDGFCDLRCVACDATWTGISGEACWFCERSRSIMIEHQIELLLRPPDVDRDDPRHATVMRAWARRLANAVKAGVVEQKLADAVWRRSVHRAA